jgi:hypothetical protein
MSHSVVNRAGKVRQLDRLAEPDEVVTEYEAKQPDFLARVLMRLLREAAAARRLWSPRIIDHQDVPVDGTGTTIYRLPHGFKGRVNWWVLDFTGGVAPLLARDASSDDNTLCLVSNEAGTVSVRIEKAG